MENKYYRNGLLLGITGALITILGDFMIGANPPADVATGIVMLDMFMNAVHNSNLRLVIGGMLGVIGTIITGIGYWRIYETLIKKHGGVMAFLYKLAVLAFIALAGTGVHLPCAVIPLLYKLIAPSDPALAIQVAEKYANYVMMPPMLIFGGLLFIALVYQIFRFGTGKTPYPRWALIFNLIFGVIPPYLLAALIGNNVVGNGIGTAAVSIGHLWMFGGLFATMKKREVRG